MGSPVTDEPKSTPGHGGARPGAGRPKGTGKKDQNDAYVLLAKAKAKRETYLAQMAELEYKERSGQLIKADRVSEIWVKHIETAKGRLLSIPGSHAGELFRAESVAEIEQRLRDALMAVMEEIANASID